MSRTAERSRSILLFFLFDGGPWAKAIVILDADNRITFATRIAMQFLDALIEVDEQDC